MSKEKFSLSRRSFLKTSGFGLASLAGMIGFRQAQPPPHAASTHHQTEHSNMAHGMLGTVGAVDNVANGFDPHEIRYDWDLGTVTEENGRTVRTWQMIATNKEFEIAPGIFFPGWVYGSRTSIESKRNGGVIGRCPGPTLRCIEGERLRVEFVNASDHPHTIHFHGIHSAFMDGISGVGRGDIQAGESFTYEFEA
jgi:FtsP/CotA-like multicopper oxidase with cupredoxin domain